MSADASGQAARPWPLVVAAVLAIPASVRIGTGGRITASAVAAVLVPAFVVALGIVMSRGVDDPGRGVARFLASVIAVVAGVCLAGWASSPVPGFAGSVACAVGAWSMRASHSGRPA